MKFLLFSIWLIIAATLTGLRNVAKASPSDSGPACFTHIYPLDQEEKQENNYFVYWRGLSSKIPIRVVLTADYVYPSNKIRGVSGVLVRVKAFDQQGKPVGQINGPGVADDAFLTGAKCSFTPPKAGRYRLKVEELNGPSESRLSQEVTLSIFQLPKPNILVYYGQWSASEGKENLFQREVRVQWDNWDLNFPSGFSYELLNSLKRQTTIQYHVQPVVPIPNINKISWVSPTHFTFFETSSKKAIQYFQYDPTRDTPRDLNFYTVKVKVLP